MPSPIYTVCRLDSSFRLREVPVSSLPSTHQFYDRRDAMAQLLGKLYVLFDANCLYIGSIIIFMAAFALCGAVLKVHAEIVGRIIAGTHLNEHNQLGNQTGEAGDVRLGRGDLKIGACTTLVIGINFGGALYYWNSGQIIALFVVTGVLWFVLLLQQGLAIVTTKESPILPVYLCRQKEQLFLFDTCTTAGAVSYTSVYYITIYFPFTRGDRAMWSVYVADRILQTLLPRRQY
ncbi:uncharacterized protein ATNIH1004_006621 [Aspergillus tanneri]|uniref:Uncharacterized protein n=1 Tax=Aspergillus tanneri TaxID=1220188 RepID=A0A5M9MTK0_9EURO|nr:uncharacterized protein ATNIH1004_006621 [Aspergillus tanneri]KAA8647919.1 hypothetical protein ATNIH1004_006621 [Aspergillus tanneri]